MTALLGLAVLLALFGVILWRRTKSSPPPPLPPPPPLVLTVECTRCGMRRSSTLEPIDQPDVFRTKNVVYHRSHRFPHEPTTDGFSVCRGVGTHDWQQL